MALEVGRDSLLLVLPAPLQRDGHGNLYFEKQACNGLDRWAENFRRVVVACPTLHHPVARGHKDTSQYLPVERIESLERIEFVTLPWAYEPRLFLRHYRRTRPMLADCIRRCEYLSFAIAGLVGDWGSVAALEAIAQKRRFSIWTDRVEHRVVRTAHQDFSGPRRLYRWVKNRVLLSPLMGCLERYVIRRCDLGLFHGRDCYEAYGPYCRTPHLVHNIHLKPEDRISPDILRGKLSRVRSGGPLRLIYAGRGAAMKGPLDWVRVMADLRVRGVDFRATWLGDGPLLAEARAEASRLGLGDHIGFPGFIGEHAELLRALREADLFVFCHKTPESPRCLIEALMSGTPIVGYDSPYPRDLIGELAEGLLVPRDDTSGLADRVAAINSDREALAGLIGRCAELGAAFSDREVFRHRSDLIKRYLGNGNSYGAEQTVAPASPQSR